MEQSRPVPDDLDALIAAEADLATVDGLADILEVCDELYQRRVTLALSVDDVAARCACEPSSIAWIDDGDVGVAVEALAYYAAAVGLRLRVELAPA